MTTKTEIKNYLNEKICATCGGSCCSSLPGGCSPEDIERMFPAETLRESVALALKTKDFAIDWWEGDLEEDEKYFIRPATTNNIGKRYDPSWGGKCVFLTKKGCKLNSLDRPYCCRMLEPKDRGCVIHGIKYKCKINNGKYNIAMIWLERKDDVDLTSFR